MPKWEDYKAQARSRGALALELYVAHTVPTGDPEAVKAALPAHLAYQAELETAGALVFAGPLSDETGEEMQGMGQIIYRAASFEAARALADNDPMHQCGARRYELRKWLVNEGSLTITLGLSRQSVTLA